jgi:hypothetical protein
MRALLSSPVAAPGCFRLARQGGLRLSRWLGLLLATGLLLDGAFAQGETAPAAKDDFSPLVKLAPFVVNGQSLSISIYARTKSDRRYGEQFAEGVARDIFGAVTENTGKGLVIIGAKGEPHPIFFFRKFLALAKDGKLDPAVSARGPELSKLMNRWEHAFDDDKSGKGSHAHKGGDLDFDKIVTALPLPLEGVGAKLYQLAWEEKFDDAKVEAKLCALRPGDLERRDLFKRFDWVFYLPPKGAFDQVLDDLIADALKQEDVGFFARVAVKGVLLVVKPKIRRAIEGMRQGMMFMTVVQARTHYSEDEVSALTDAYIEEFMPDEKKSTGGTDHERAVKAVRARLKRIEEGEASLAKGPLGSSTTQGAQAEKTQSPTSNP